MHQIPQGDQVPLPAHARLQVLPDAPVTLAGIELAPRARKRQFKFEPGQWSCGSLKKQWHTALS